MSDPFEEHFQQWLHGIWWEEKCKQKNAYVTAFINGLQKRGHVVSFDYTLLHIMVDNTLAITLRNASETPPEELLQWTEMHLRWLERTNAAHLW
jgi:hypothetical protein